MKSEGKGEISSSGMLATSQVFNNHMQLVATTITVVKREKLSRAVLSRHSWCWWSWLHLQRGPALPLLPPNSWLSFNFWFAAHTNLKSFAILEHFFFSPPGHPYNTSSVTTVNTQHTILSDMLSEPSFPVTQAALTFSLSFIPRGFFGWQLSFLLASWEGWNLNCLTSSISSYTQLSAFQLT